jgi:hypothetical protein
MSKNKIENESTQISWANKDIFIVYYFITFVTLTLMVVEYIAYLHGIYIQFSLEIFAKTLNVGITIIGSSEGIRSFTKSAGEKVGTCAPVPAYKLRYLLSYMVSFIFLTGLAVFFHLSITQMDITSINGDTVFKPEFAHDTMSHGLLSNFLCYLIARYGGKLAENIDLSELVFFKKK